MNTDKLATLVLVSGACVLAIFLLGSYIFWQTVADKYEARLVNCRGPIFRVPLTKSDIGTYQAVTSDLSGQIYMMEPYTPPSKRFVMKNADGKRKKK